MLATGGPGQINIVRVSLGEYVSSGLNAPSQHAASVIPPIMIMMMVMIMRR